jgi:hypothetical protein
MCFGVSNYHHHQVAQCKNTLMRNASVRTSGREKSEIQLFANKIQIKLPIFQNDSCRKVARKYVKHSDKYMLLKYSFYFSA